MTIKNVFVDYDNTLHDSDSKFVAHFEGPALELGITGRELWRLYLFEVHRDTVHRWYPERHDDREFHCRLIFQKLGRPYREELASRITSAFERAMEECWRNPTFFPEAFRFLDEVSSRYRLCLATSENAPQKASSVERVGGKKYFHCVLGDHNIGIRKTKKEYYLRALELAGARAEESVMVGDSTTHDIVPAWEAGMKTIWVNRRGETFSGRRDCEVRDLEEALRCLSTITFFKRKS
ncbi:MAG: HAD family hydrolase [Candidatus Hadarchaeales archaeon]